MLNFANIWDELKHVYSMVKTYVMGYIGTILGLFSGVDIIQVLAGIGGIIFIYYGIINRRLDRELKKLELENKRKRHAEKTSERHAEKPQREI